MTLAFEDANSKLVEVVTVADVDDEDRVGNSLLLLWKLRFGHKTKLLFRHWAQNLVKILKLKFYPRVRCAFGNVLILKSIFSGNYNNNETLLQLTDQKMIQVIMPSNWILFHWAIFTLGGINWQAFSERKKPSVLSFFRSSDTSICKFVTKGVSISLYEEADLIQSWIKGNWLWCQEQWNHSRSFFFVFSKRIIWKCQKIRLI